MSRTSHWARFRGGLALGLLAAAVATAHAGGGSTPSAAERPRPSLLLITLDTTRADHLGCYGASFAATPNLDALARAGVRFDNALSPAPLTLPSHATMLTGLVPRRHGVRDNALFRLAGDVPVLSESLRRAGYRTAAFVAAAVLDRGTGLDRGFQHYDDSVRIGDRRAFNYEERAASQVTDAALAHLPRLRPPFLLWVHYFDPHKPWVPPEPFRERFAKRPYDGEIAFMDHEIGRLLETVRGRAGPLVVAAAGDHGESLGEHGEETHGVFVYQATQRVPLILAGTGLPAGVVIRDHAGLVDLAPTLLELLGLPPIADVDGRSLLPRVQAAARAEPPAAAAERSRAWPSDYEMESFFPRFAYGWAPLRALVDDGFKYIEAPEPELYDLGADPGERDNLLRREATGGSHPTADPRETAARMRELLLARTAGDEPASAAVDPELAEQRRRLQALGYVGGTSTADDADEEAIDPKRAIAWLADLDAARRELQTGDPRRAIGPLERLLSRNPGNVPARLALVQARLGSGDVEGAIVAARQAAERSPDDELVTFHLANALAEKARREPATLAEARAAYERALERNPRFADAYLNYAALLVRHGDFDDALALLGRARAAGVADPDVETELAVLELRRGNLGPARQAFARALALNPCAADVHEALGRLAERERRPAEAATHYERALACQPNPELRERLGRLRESARPADR